MKKRSNKHRKTLTLEQCEPRLLLTTGVVDNNVLEIGTNLNFLFQQDSTNLLSSPSGTTLANGTSDVERWPFALRDGVDWASAYDYNAGTRLSNNNPWRQEFLDDLNIYSQLRTIHWTNTNGSGIETWSQRTDPNTDQTQLSLFGTTTTSTPNNGVAWEWIIDLGNRLGKDIWINIPLMADDNYVQELGCLLDARLDPNLNVYVEYHNELWLNKEIIGDSRDTTEYAVDMAIAEGIDDGTGGFGNVLRWQAHRSAEIWDKFETEFGSTFSNRVVKVVAGQGANVNVGEQLRDYLRDPSINTTSPLELEHTYAIAPYFGAAITDPNDFATLQAAADAEVVQAGLNVDAWNTVGTPVVSYEGGQHLTGGIVSEAVLFGMNSDPQIKTVYLNYLQGLEDEGLERFNHFTHSGIKKDLTGNSDEAWGAKQYIGQPASEAPKFQALAEFAGVTPSPTSRLVHDGAVGTYFTSGSTTSTTNIPSEASWVSEVSASDIVAGVGLGDGSPPDQTNGWFNNEFAPIGWGSATLAAAIASNDYLSFSVTVDPGHTLEMTALDITLRNQNQTRNFVLLSSATGFNTSSVLTDFGGPIGNGKTDVTVDLFGTPGLAGLTGTTEFRIYVYGNPAAFEVSGIADRTVTGPEFRVFGKVEADNQLPNITTATPVNLSAHSPAGPVTISGAAADDSSVIQVNLAIYDQNFDTWNGTAFTSAYSIVVADLSAPGATLTDWTYDFMPPGEGVYAARATAVDNDFATKQGWWYTFLAGTDNQVPAISVVTPAASGSTHTGVIDGTATDDKGINRVAIVIYNSSNQTWDGSAFTTPYTRVNASLGLLNGTATSWSYNIMPPSGTYTFRATAIDVVNKQVNGPWRTFLVP